MDFNVNFKIDINLHVSPIRLEPIEVHIRERETVDVEPSPPPTPAPAVRAFISIGGNMPGQITVDTTNESVSLQFVDDKGDAAAAPDGAQVAFASDNPTVATVTTDPNNPLQGDISPVGVGSANISATITDASGNPINEPNGQPFAVDPVAVTVSPGQATGASLVLSA